MTQGDERETSKQSEGSEGSEGSEDVDDHALTLLGTQLDASRDAPSDASALEPAALSRLLERSERAKGVERLGHYLLLERVGAGGMGVVYAAFDEKLERKVALKLLHTPGDPDAQRRLVREAQAMARLSHPNVVQIYEISEHGAAVFIVMEYVRGETMRAWLAERPRSHAEILATFSAAGRGLAAAHTKGLVHRDFKPDNVMLHRDGRVLVMDFGLAYQANSDAERFSEVRGPSEASLGQTASTTFERTAAGALMGTPAYMAPEQFNAMDTDARTDQFAYCVALWEALHGERPFHGRTLGTLAKAVTKGERVPFESSAVAPWLRKVIDRGLSVDPSARWPSMSALLEATTRDPTRRRRLTGASVAVALGLAAGAAGLHLSRERTLSQQLAACTAEGDAITQVWNERTRTRLAEAFTATQLELAPKTWSRARGWLDDYVRAWSEARSQLCRAADIEHSMTPQLAATARTCLDERRAAIEGLLDAWAQPDAALVARAATAATELPPLSTCLDESTASLRPDAPDALAAAVTQLRTELERAAAAEFAGNYQTSLDAAERALSEARELGWAPLEAEAQLARGRALARTDALESAHDSLRAAQLSALAAGHDLVALEASTWLTSVARRRDLPEQALAWAELGQALVVRLGLEHSLQEAALLTNLGVTLRGLGELERALEVQGRSLEIREAVLGPLHPGVANTLNNIGVIRWSLGDYAQALANHARALDIATAAFGTEHRLVLSAQSNIANVHMAQGDLASALSSHREVLRIKQLLFGATHSTCAAAHNNVGVVLRELGQALEALEHFEAATELWSERLGPDHARVGTARVGLGQALHDLGELQRARRELDAADALLTDSSPAERGELSFALARLSWDEGQHAPARDSAHAAALAYAEVGAASRAQLTTVQTWLREHPLPDPSESAP